MASTPGSGSDSQSPVAAANGVAETIETNHLVTDSSDDDDIQTRPPRKHGAPDEDEVPELEKDEDGDNAGDLFGSASEDEGKRYRTLDSRHEVHNWLTYSGLLNDVN